MLAAGDQAAFFTWLSQAERRFEAELHRCLIAVSESDLLLVHGLQEDRIRAGGRAEDPARTGLHIPVTYKRVTKSIGNCPALALRLVEPAHVCRLPVLEEQGGLNCAPRGCARILTPKRPFAAEIARRRLPTLAIYSPAIVPRPRTGPTTTL
jgi:hypothetical protein